MEITGNEQVDQLDREQFWGLVYEQLARLRANPVGWQAYIDEIETFDALSGDGIENEEPYYSPSEARQILADDGKRD